MTRSPLGAISCGDLDYTPNMWYNEGMQKSVYSVGATPGPFPTPIPDKNEALLDDLIETTVPDGRPKKALVPLKKKGPGRPSLMRKRLPAIIALASQGWSHRQIAEYLTEKEGVPVTKDSIRMGLYRIRKSGQLLDTEEKLTYMAAPMAVETIVEAIAEGNVEISEATLRGLGYFKSHQMTKQEGGPARMELSVSFTRPTEGDDAKVVEGSVVGHTLENPEEDK